MRKKAKSLVQEESMGPWKNPMDRCPPPCLPTRLTDFWSIYSDQPLGLFFFVLALTINPGAGQLGFFLAREAKELGQSMILAYDAASSVDSYNSKLDQMIYTPCPCASGSIRDIINWLYNGVRGLTEPRENIFTNQMIGLRPIANYPALPIVSSSSEINWTVAGSHQILTADDTRIVIRAMSAGGAGTQLFGLDWCNYLYQPVEEAGLDMSAVAASGRGMVVNSSNPYAVGDILSARYFLSPMGCASRSQHLLRLGKIKVINKLAWTQSADEVDLRMSLVMTGASMPNCDVAWVFTALSHLYTLIAALEEGIPISRIDWSEVSKPGGQTGGDSGPWGFSTGPVDSSCTSDFAFLRTCFAFLLVNMYRQSYREKGSYSQNYQSH